MPKIIELATVSPYACGSVRDPQPHMRGRGLMSASSFSETPQKTRLAIAGLGLVGLRHLEAIGVLPDCTLCAVMDPRPEARATAQRHGAACFDNFAQMLETARPDGVILSTPTKMHVTQATDCVRAGIPALVEKPLSDDLPSAATLVDCRPTRWR